MQPRAQPESVRGQLSMTSRIRANPEDNGTTGTWVLVPRWFWAYATTLGCNPRTATPSSQVAHWELVMVEVVGWDWAHYGFGLAIKTLGADPRTAPRWRGS
eukprot:4593122-Pyramimonas_sp.AAC.1